MKKLLFFLILFISCYTITAKELKYSGIYQGENLYVLNPFASTGVGFCIYRIQVNGEVTTDDINSSSIEIDFEAMDIIHGDKVEVVIKHKGDCQPKVINPDVLKPKSTFDVTNLAITALISF